MEGEIMSAPEQTLHNQRTVPFARPSRRGAGCVALVALLLGLVIGAAGALLYISSTESDRPPLATPAAQSNGAIVVQLGNSYMTRLVEKDISSAGLPGTIENVQVATQNDQLVVTGDDRLTVFGIPITKNFTLLLQPLAQSCQFRVHVLHADLGGMPITGFVASFEDNINQQLHFGTAGLPPGFAYCTTGVRTGAQGLSLILSATPTT
jgi:hypothetical protein